MLLATRRKVLLFLLLFGAVLALVAAALPLLELQPGLPPPRMENGLLQMEVGVERQHVDYKVNDFFFTLLMILLAAGVLGAIYRAVRGTSWKELRQRLLRYAGISLIVICVLAVIFFLIPTGEALELEQEAIPTPVAVEAVLLDAPPPSLIWIIGIVLAASGALMVFWFLRARQSPDTAMLLLEQEAEKARQALLTGASLREVILQCYRQMSSALQEDHGIERQAYMTTGDFERLLAAEGFPPGPVEQLTGLFNAVRYGRWQPGLDDDQKAIACLDAIIQYSRETREAGKDD